METSCLSNEQTVVVIGYGNPLRGDDGVGQRIAGAVASWGLPGIQAFAEHQLTVDMAGLLAGVDTAIFVDACVAREGEGVKVSPIDLQGAPVSWEGTAHTGDPRAIIALTGAVYGRCPAAWIVTVPGHNFDLGETLSPGARRGMTVALRKIHHLVVTQCTKSASCRTS